MKRLAALTAAALACVLAPTAQAQTVGPAHVFIDCRVIMPGHGIDTHKATDYVEVTIVNTRFPLHPHSHEDGIMYARDGIKVLYDPKRRWAWNYKPQAPSAGVPVDFCEFDIQARRQQ